MIPSTPPTRFDELREIWQRELEAGRLEAAVEVIDEACRWAEEHGSRDQQDLGLCNRAAVAVELRQGDRYVPRLRQILVAGGDAVNARLAAYNIGRYYELTKDFKKALFYARIARDRSLLIGRDEWLASSHNQVGSALLAESRVAEATAEYEKALALMPADSRTWRARILDNLGYCRVLQGRVNEGFALLYQSLHILRRCGARRYELSTRLDLSFAHLQSHRLRHARRHAERALALAREADEADSIKNALFLLGEVASVAGDDEEAAHWFGLLQRDFFPDAAYLSGFLQAVNVCGLINLHA